MMSIAITHWENGALIGVRINVEMTQSRLDEDKYMLVGAKFEKLTTDDM